MECLLENAMGSMPVSPLACGLRSGLVWARSTYGSYAQEKQGIKMRR